MVSSLKIKNDKLLYLGKVYWCLFILFSPKKTCRRFLPFKSYCSVWLYLHVCRSPSSLGMEQVFLKFSHHVFCCHPEANSRYHINCTNYHLSVLVCTNTAFHCSMKCRSLDHHFSLLKVIAISEVAHDNF